MANGEQRIRVVPSTGRDAWQALVGDPGALGAQGAERAIFASADGRFTVGLWEREPDTWSFERTHDEVSLILAGDAEIEIPDGSVVTIGPGDVLVTPKGSRGTWRIRDKVVKLYAIYET
jgi:uncharacterized cupin superfamily protein